MNTRKLSLLFVITLITSLMLSSFAFAAGPATPPERFSVQIKGLDVYNSTYDNKDGTHGAWYHLTHTTNNADIVYLNSNSAVQSWFNTETLTPGTYTKVRMVISNSFTIRGHYTNGTDEYWTKPGVNDKAVKYDPGTASNADVIATIPSSGIPSQLLIDAANNDCGAGWLVVFNGNILPAQGGPSPSYASDDIIYRYNTSFTLAENQPAKNLVVTWNINNVLLASNYNGTDCDVNFKLPTVGVALQ